MSEPIASHDADTKRCPMLGHELTFAYCRSPGQDVPCRKIFDCWWQDFDIAAFMHAHYPPATIEQVLAEKKPKVLSLIEIIQRAGADLTGGPKAVADRRGGVDHVTGSSLRTALQAYWRPYPTGASDVRSRNCKKRALHLGVECR